MARILVEPDYTMEVERRYSEWGRQLPREPGQIGGPLLFSITHPFGEVEFPDAFVDEIERVGIPFERL